jgi:hypothetical protein
LTCKRGHVLESKDVYIEPSTGSRTCKICRREKRRIRYHNDPAFRASRLAFHKKYYKVASRKLDAKFAQLKAQAKSRQKDFTLTKEFYFTLVTPNTCHYCGGTLPETGTGIDRIDHRTGYTAENVVPCCTSCNTRKGALEGAGFVYPRTVTLLQELVQSNG